MSICIERMPPKQPVQRKKKSGRNYIVEIKVILTILKKVNKMYFEKAGKENTERTLLIAKEEALKRGINHIVVASTFGDTALQPRC